MIVAVDYAGVALVITAAGTLVASLTAAVISLRTHAQIQTGNGTNIGTAVAEAKEVATDTNEKVTAAADPTAGP